MDQGNCTVALPWTRVRETERTISQPWWRTSFLGTRPVKQTWSERRRWFLPLIQACGFWVQFTGVAMLGLSIRSCLSASEAGSLVFQPLSSTFGLGAPRVCTARTTSPSGNCHCNEKSGGGSAKRCRAWPRRPRPRTACRPVPPSCSSGPEPPLRPGSRPTDCSPLLRPPSAPATSPRPPARGQLRLGAEGRGLLRHTSAPPVLHIGRVPGPGFGREQPPVDRVVTPSPA